MSLSIIYYYLLIFMIVITYNDADKSKAKVDWIKLFIIEILSLLSSVCYIEIYNHLSIDNYPGGVFKLMANDLAKFILSLIIIISIIGRIILRNKLQNTKPNKGSSKTLLYIAIIIIAFTITTIVDMKPVIEEKNKSKEYSEYVLQYLNKKYGNKNYKIEKIYNNNYCGLGCLDIGSSNSYNFVISSDFSKELDVEIRIPTKEIVRDKFEDYYYETR